MSRRSGEQNAHSAPESLFCRSGARTRVAADQLRFGSRLAAESPFCPLWLPRRTARSSTCVIDQDRYGVGADIGRNVGCGQIRLAVVVEVADGDRVRVIAGSKGQCPLEPPIPITQQH